jgi:hypothetical protein
LSNGGDVTVSGSSSKVVDDRKNRWLYSLDHDKAVNSAYFSTLVLMLSNFFLRH